MQFPAMNSVHENINALCNLVEKRAVHRLRDDGRARRTQQQVTAFYRNFGTGIQHAQGKVGVHRDLKRLFQLSAEVIRC